MVPAKKFSLTALEKCFKVEFNYIYRKEIKVDVYQKAARLVVKSNGLRFSCSAIDKVDNNRESNEWSENTKLYQSYFQHVISEEDHGWWGSDDFSPEQQLVRSLALLFMSEITKGNEKCL